MKTLYNRRTGTVAAIALGFLLAVVIFRSTTMFSAPVVILATQIAICFAAFPAVFPSFLENFSKPSASFVLFEPVLVSIPSDILQSPLNPLISFPVC